jgi:hypothetical protein
MTPTLSPDMEARVRSVAELRGQSVEEALLVLINRGLKIVENELMMKPSTGAEDHNTDGE